MSVRGVVMVVVSVFVVGVVSACESTATGTPTPESGVSSETPTSPTGPERLVPPIEDPKDLTGIDPCELLTESQLAALTITEPGTKDESPWGEDTCGWTSSTLRVAFDPDTTQGDGLEGDYQNRDNFESFEESEVDGYPAARTDFATQFCSVIVGVADDQVLTVHYGRVASDAPGKGDPCGFAESIASTVLTNLPDA